MGSLSYWTMVVVSYQTIFSIVFSYVTLTCQLRPEMNELHELTLMKLLYLYDPQACSRIFFYNYTEIHNHRQVYSSIVWPLNNHVAASFRSKLKLWMSLHIFWVTFAFLNLVINEQPCKFLAAVLPFTITGSVILGVDLVFMSVFVADSRFIRTEADLLSYISDENSVNITIVNKKVPGQEPSDEDLSWIPLIMAYTSCRAVIQWIINFWMIKDNFFDGLQYYRRHAKKRIRHPI